MTHYAGFVITSQQMPARRKPSEEELKTAVAEAQKLAEAALARLDDAQGAPESLGIGTTQYRMIQGNLQTNYNTFAPMPSNEWPQCTEDFWSEAKGRTREAAEAAEDIVRSSWNAGRALVEMALDHHNMERQPYPQVLITPDGLISHHIGWPDADVFGDKEPGGTARRFTKKGPAEAWHAAAEPLRDLAKASFRVEYLAIMARHPENIVIALDWNI